MPAIKKTRVSLDLKNNPRLATEPGDWNYLFTMEFIRMWKENPRYATFHKISRCYERPETDPGVWEINRSLNATVNTTDLMVARKEAIAEFRRSVIARYEDQKYADSSNVNPYAEV